MHWNYRLIDMTHENGGEPWVELFEVYYNDDGSLMGYAPPSTGGSDVAELKQAIKRMQEALDKPILKVEDFDSQPEPTKSEVLQQCAEANGLPTVELTLAPQPTPEDLT